MRADTASDAPTAPALAAARHDEAEDANSQTVTIHGPVQAPGASHPEGLAAARRAATALGASALVAAVGAGWQQSLHGTSAVLSLALIGLAATAALHVVRLRSGVRSPALTTALGVAASAVTIASMAHMGPLSFSAVPLTILVFYFAQDDSRSRAWAVYAVCVLGPVLVALLSFAGALPLTEAVYAMTYENRRALVNLTIFLQLVLAGAFFLGRGFQRSAALALEELARAHRELARREAQLGEARAEAERARGKGGVGRCTGERIGGYAMELILGRGGMGEVYSALDLAQGARVAVKVLHAHLQSDPESLQRFFREARICGTLSSPHVASVIEAGSSDDGTPFIAMELLEGEDLGAILRDRGTLTPKEICDLAEHVAEALAVAQTAGVIHRDLKPQNLFRVRGDGDPVWKVLDFGVSTLLGAVAGLTQGKIIGTPVYMSPEQAQCLPLDHRADLYSLGVVTYRALTGRHPHTGTSAVAILERVLTAAPPAPSTFTHVPPDVELVLALGLAKEPSERFSNARDFARALRSAFAGELTVELRARGTSYLARRPWGENHTKTAQVATATNDSPTTARPGPPARSERPHA